MTMMLNLLDSKRVTEHSCMKVLLWITGPCCQYVGIRGAALMLLQSYLTDRSFSVKLDEFSSSMAPLTCGVPQGSILGLLLFSLYMPPLGSIFRRHNISFHCYADDVQIYLPLKKNCKDTLNPLFACLVDIKTWLSQSHLNFNDNKTEVIVFGHPECLFHSVADIGPLASKTILFIKSVTLDTDLNFKRQIGSVVKGSFHQLQLLAKVKPYLSFKDLERVIHAFISSRLDYCNSLYVGLDQCSLHRLQLVQNAVAHLLTGTKKWDHITPVLASLHWLPIHFRIHFKVLLFVFKILSGLAPQYLGELLQVHNPVRALRSSSQQLFEVPRSKLWNNLPLHFRHAESLEMFRSSLKTHFSLWLLDLL